MLGLGAGIVSVIGRSFARVRPTFLFDELVIEQSFSQRNDFVRAIALAMVRQAVAQGCVGERTRPLLLHLLPITPARPTTTTTTTTVLLLFYYNNNNNNNYYYYYLLTHRHLTGISSSDPWTSSGTRSPS